MPYVTGGLAVGEVQAGDALTPASGSTFRAGWTAGGGIETVIAQNWTFKAEYLYMDLGSAQLFNIVPGVPETVSFKANLVRIGIDYKFWWSDPPRPLVAKN
jgi:outer membrane immunogenic protein